VAHPYFEFWFASIHCFSLLSVLS